MENHANIRDEPAKSIFLDALEIATSEERKRYLDDRCGSDARLRAEVESLLRHHGQLGDYLEQPPADAVPTQDHGSRVPLEAAGTVIGPYKLLEPIGEGGMGVVYMAEQARPVRRKVALKIIKPGMDTKQVVSRFEAERQALALMDHPNIARVLDAGATESGLPYFVMELVRGIPITEYCDLEHLTIAERLELFVQVCRAVQHAHQKGIIHRDLKPSNILVTVIDGAAVPKIIDFGVAKAVGQSLTERTLYTGFAQFLGTPLYMSPEQAALSGVDVDTRSDVYALGVLLYELLTGTTPFDKETLGTAALDEMRRIIREQEPPRPSTRLSALGATLTTVLANRKADARDLERSVRGELDWIVMKPLEKDRRRRYETASDFAADVRRYLVDEPVQACPPSAWYRLSKYGRRNRVALTTASLIAFALIAGTVVSTWQAMRATRAEGRAEAQRRIAERNADEARQQTIRAEQARTEAERERNAASRNLYFSDIRLGLVDWRAGNLERLSHKLSDYLPQPGRDDLRGWEWYYLLSLCHQEERTLVDHSNLVTAVAWSPNGRYVASASHDGTARVWDATSWRLVRTLHPGRTFKCCVSWSPDSQCLALGAAASDNAIYLWYVKSDEVKTLRGHVSSVWTVAWSPDGGRLASGGIIDGTVRIWDPSTAVCLRTLGETRNNVTSVAWSPDGSHLASTYSSSGMRVWDVADGKLLHEGGPQSYSNSVDWSRDGKRLALGDVHGDLVIYRTTDWSEAVRWHGHAGNVSRVAWAPEGGRLASAGVDSLVRLWNPADGSSLLTLRGHRTQATAVAWEPGGRRLVSAGMDRTVKVWSTSSPSQPRRLAESSGGVQTIAWSDEPGILRAFDVKARAVTDWDTATGVCRRKVAVPGGSQGRFSPGGTKLAIASDLFNPPRVVVCDMLSGKPPQTVPAQIPRVIAFSPDATRLALGRNTDLEVVDLPQEEVLIRSKIQRISDASWSPDRRLLAVVGCGEPSDDGNLGWAGWVHLFDVVKREKVWRGRHGIERVTVSAVAWSPDGTRLVSGDLNGRAVVWEIPAGRQVVSSQVHATQVNALAWSPDGRRIASVSKDKTLLVWDPASGEELLRFDLPDAYGKECRWAPDGRRLAAVDANGTILVWDTTAGYHYLNGQEYLLERTIAEQEQAGVLWNRGQKADCLALTKRVMESLTTTLGPDHERTVSAGHGLAHQYLHLGRFSEAIPLLERSLAAQKAQQDTDFNEIVHLAVCLAGTYREVGEFDRAEPVLTDLLASCRKAVPPRPKEIAAVLVMLGQNREDRRKYADAEPLLRECLAIREQIEPDDWKTFNTKSVLGGSLLGQKKYAEAEPLLKAGYEGMKQREKTIPPQGKIRLTEAVERLVQLYDALGRKDRAEEWRSAARNLVRPDPRPRPPRRGRPTRDGASRRPNSVSASKGSKTAST